MQKILIIDDEPLVRRSLARVLSDRYLTIEAEDGLQGLAKWIDDRPDMVIIDVLMPGKTGPEVIKEVPDEIRRKTKIVLISAFAGGYNINSAKSIGADIFISKPFLDIFAVKKEIENCLSQQLSQ